MDALPVPGMLIRSNVRLTRPLAAGGMGSVWLAEHLNLQIDVAVKFLAPELANVPEARLRFEREAAAAAQVKSRHVVQIFDRGVTDQGLLYIVMELLVGEDLGKRIERLGPRPLAEVVTIVTQVARALQSAHAQSIVHRDIKPENVFLLDADGDLFVKLLDFGVVKRPQDEALNVTGLNAMIGTPHFMSPEQVLRPKDVDCRSDLWSLAVVAYVGLTAVLPFDGDTVGALCVALNSGTFKPVTRHRMELPAELDDWFVRALQLDPAARFDSARDMAGALAVAAGLSLPRFPSQPDSDARGTSDRSVPLGFFSIETPRQDETPFGTTLSGSGSTPKPKSSKRQVATAILVVMSSALSSVVTTLFFLQPTMFESLLEGAAGALHGAAATGSQQSGTLSSALTGDEPKPASADASSPHEEDSNAPIVAPVVPGAGFSVEVQASTPEGGQATAGAVLPNGAVLPTGVKPRAAGAHGITRHPVAPSDAPNGDEADEAPGSGDASEGRDAPSPESPASGDSDADAAGESPAEQRPAPPGPGDAPDYGF